MHFQCIDHRRGFATVVIMMVAFVMLILSSAEHAFAIPVFARKYQTACATCHAGFPKLNQLGLAFKMNGYRFPRDDEEKVKQAALQLGNDSYRDIFPNSILPSSIPGYTPVAFEYQQLMTTNMWTHQGPAGAGSPGPSPDFNFPAQFNILTAGTLTKNISIWGNFGFEPGNGQFDPFIERAFLIFNNLCAPDEEEDEDGLHLAHVAWFFPNML